MKIKIILNSGHVIDLECSDIKVQHDPATSKLVLYEINNMKGTKLVHLVMSEVAAITRDLDS
jgi:hypothetical protein